MRKGKSNDEFFDASIDFFRQEGKRLEDMYPGISDEYNDHTLLKLISITYWAGIFSPIAHRQLKERYGYCIAYVDTMAGSGVTKTRRAGDYFCGSCTGVVLSSRKKFPFDKIIAVEINPDKATALEARLKQIEPNLNLSIYTKDIFIASSSIVKEIEKSCFSYIVIDPEGFEGMSWASIGPLLKCKGDAMLTWFEMDAWRMRGAALSDANSAEMTAMRLTELIGSEKWKTAYQPSDLTDMFINRVYQETSKGKAEWIDIEDNSGKHYKMILFVGRKAQSLAAEWKKHMEKRLGSSKGRNIGKLLDRKAGRIQDLRDYMPHD